MIEFPGLKNFMEESIKTAKEKGYVKTLFGRKRRLPDVQLPDFEFFYSDDSPVSDEDYTFYYNMLCRKSFKQREATISNIAKKYGIRTLNNGGFIARAERQCVNARIQGGAGDQIKIAMRKVAEDEMLNKLGFRLLLQIHDELIGECPKENAKEAGERFKYIMEHALEGILKVPSKCDLECFYHWNGDSIDL